MDPTNQKKELNEMLPSDLINEMNMETEGTQAYEDEEEIVDNLAFKPKQEVQNANFNPNIINNQKTRFYSDCGISFNSSQNQGSNKTSQQSGTNQMIQDNYIMPIFSPPSMFKKQNTYSINMNPFINQNLIQGIGMSMINIPIERKTTDPFYLSYINNDIYQNYQNINYVNSNNPNLCHYTRKNTGPGNNVQSNKSSKMSKGSGKFSDINIDKYEIEEFQNYINSLHCEVSEYVCTQKGSKEVQKYLNKSPSECRTVLINAMKDNMINVMINSHGNYFCQRMIKICTQSQILLILNYIKKDFISIAKNYCGTHALQALLDMITTKEEESEIILSIQDFELEMAYDNNATHVLQKMIMCIEEDNRSQLNNILISNLSFLCFDSNGICVAKKIINTTVNQSNKIRIIKIITDNCLDIAQDPYGNYAIQLLFKTWKYVDYSEIIQIFIQNIRLLSIQKYSSCVSEKLIELLDMDKKDGLFKELFDESQILNILKDQYGKFVLQKAVKLMSPKQKEDMKGILNQLIISSSKGKSKLKSFITCFGSS